MNQTIKDSSHQVSSRNLNEIVSLSEQQNIPLEKLTEGTSLTRDLMLDTNRYISWQEFTTLCNNVNELIDEKVLLDRYQSSTSPFRMLRLMGHLVYDLKELFCYAFGENGLVTQLYPLNVTVEEVDSNHLIFNYEMRDDLSPSKVLHVAILGQLMGLPRLHGYPLAKVKMTRTTRGAIYDVTYSGRRNLWSRINTAWNWLATARSIGRELEQTHRELISQNRELEQEIKKTREVERVNRATQAMYQLLADNVQDIIWTTDLDLNFTYLSPSVEGVLGYTPEEGLGTPFNALIQEETKIYLMEHLETQLSSYAYEPNPDANTVLELEVTKKDGSRIQIEIKASFMRDENGKAYGVVGVARDISQRHQAEKDRKKLESQLQVSQRMDSIGQFAGGIAHDFNNLLVAILGYSDLALNQQGLSPEAREFVGEIKAAGERAAALTQKLLTFSKRQFIEPMPINVNDLISELQKMILRLMPENIELDFRLASDIGTIMADPGQIEQILINLCLNARDAMPSGGKLRIETAAVTIDEDFVSQHSWSTQGTFMHLSVSDNGTGISAAALEHIFEPFYTTKPEGEGTGLGLAVVFGIVQQHRGFINVYSESGMGSHFNIYLPTVEETPSQNSPSVSAKSQRGSETILLVEDNEHVRKLANRILSDHGYRVLEAADGPEALVIYEQAADGISLVLLDVVMPKMNGEEVMMAMKDINPNPCILFASGYSPMGVHTSFILEKNYNLIQKPYSPAQLLDQIRNLLD
ncbi:MAG: PAS domain S-box protein [Gammaproteobacteria bacterium]|nr:PAS domain S-box protein [Gammaproteobacteria bacterium]